MINNVQTVQFAKDQVTYVLDTCGNTTTNKNPPKVAGTDQSAKTDLSTCSMEE